MKGRKVLTLIRTGYLHFQSGTENQCYEKNHRDFKYKIELSFETSKNPDILLDNNTQLFDHNDLDDFIVKNMSSKALSCEKLHIKLYAVVWSFLLRKFNCKDNLLKYRAELIPYSSCNNLMVEGKLIYKVFPKE